MPLFAFETSQDDGFVRKLGFIDETGKLVIEQKYSWSAYSHFNKHGYCVVNTDVNWSQAIINHEGSTLLTLPKGYFNFVMSPPDAHGIFPVEHRLDSDDPKAYEIQGRDRVYIGRTRHYGINLNGEIIFEKKFSSGADGYYQLEEPPQNGKKRCLGIINHEGKVTVPAEFEWMSWSRTDACVSVIRDGLFGVIDYYGREIIPISHGVRGFQDISASTDGVIVYFDRSKGKCVSVNLEGQLLAELPTTYWSPSIPNACPILSDGLMKITEGKGSKEGQSYYVDAHGNHPMRGFWNKPKKFDPECRLGYFNDGLATYRVDNLSGYIHKSGAVTIDAQYESAGNFTNGLAKVFPTKDDRFKKRYRYINTDGEVVAQNY